MFVVKLGRLTNNSTNRLGTSKLNWTLQCCSIAIVNLPRGRRHCTHPLIVTTSLDTRPLKSTWTSCTNYAHARTVDTRRTFPLFNAPGYEATFNPAGMMSYNSIVVHYTNIHENIHAGPMHIIGYRTELV